MRGITCQETPKRSVSHPHGPSSPPSAVSFSASVSISRCVSQETASENACEKWKVGPPFMATYGLPSSSNATVRAVPAGIRPTSP